jgi:hypothetical protein
VRIAVCAVIVVSIGSTVSGGQLYGSIFQNNRPLQGAPLALICGGESIGGTTDGDGVYRLFARANGGCTLVVEPDGRRATAAVYSYDRPTAYSFDLINRGGRWELILRK